MYPQLQAGQRVLLAGHPRADFNQEYVITAVEHQKTAKEYRNTFRCLPAQIQYRPQPITPTPVIAGVVPAIVIGPQGETKHVDQFGRVKVRFPWRSPGHSNQNDPGDGGYVRVAQIATGVGAAAMWLPDVGDEVLVAFEHSDPNRPVVIGSVYNGKDMPPVALPANKHLSIFRSQSTSGQKTEMVYDGTVGNERLVIQSGANVLTLGASGIAVQASSVAITSGTDLVQRVGRNVVVEGGNDVLIKSGQNLSLSGQKDAQLTVGSNMQLAVGSNLQLSVGSNLETESGKDMVIKTGQNFTLQSQRTMRLTAGEDAVIQTGKSFVANSGAMFQFVAAQTGTIEARAGLFLKSPTLVAIESADVVVKSSGNLTLKGAKITQN
jgi:type VI secretion system secreted protein VgrG